MKSLIVAGSVVLIGGLSWLCYSQWLDNGPLPKAKPVAVVPKTPAVPLETKQYCEQALAVVDELRSYANLAATGADAPLLKAKSRLFRDLHSKLPDPPAKFAESHREMLQISAVMELMADTYSVAIQATLYQDAGHREAAMEKARKELLADMAEKKKAISRLREGFLNPG